SSAGPSDSLVSAIGAGRPDGLAPIPGLRLTAPERELQAQLDRLWKLLRESPLGASAARKVLDERRARSPLQIARVLASAYGHTLEPVVYTQGVAISGRLRLAALEPSDFGVIPDVVSLVEPLVSGENEAFRDAPSTPTLAGVVWGDELADATGDRRFADLVVRAANLYTPKGRGEPPPPSSHNFRTEDFFMNGAMLGRAFKITGNRRYLAMLTRFLLDSEVQQDDGLFWHCRTAPYYWGRGNGFAALGLAETLTYLLQDHPDREDIRQMCVRQLDGLRRLQQPSGMWLQVLNFPGSYQEFTVTCMVGYALARGLRLGWLDSSCQDMLELAWQGVSERIDAEGNIVDGCAGTGEQKSLRDYLDRPAIFGFDDRSGSMAIWFATEMERLMR
ncbi:MAG: glycoside hydrolase family 88 protein, partial [Chloroflexi bacterium]|nr:glycoside hydrolase family 88 protein [Chloroflexota bacterium]